MQINRQIDAHRPRKQKIICNLFYGEHFVEYKDKQIPVLLLKSFQPGRGQEVDQYRAHIVEDGEEL